MANTTFGAATGLEATVYTTTDGDVLDWVAWKHYGHQRAGTVEMVLNVNPGLCELGAILPAGVPVVLPVLPDAPRKPKMAGRFWQ